MNATSSSRRLVRAASRAAVLGAALAVPLAAIPAHAEVPDGWSNPEPVPVLHALLVLGGIPLLLFVVITLLTLAPSLARGQRIGPASDEPEWFGGKRAVDELEAAEGDAAETGGASGRW